MTLAAFAHAIYDSDISPHRIPSGAERTPDTPKFQQEIT
jgi:hypothetical protein